MASKIACISKAKMNNPPPREWGGAKIAARQTPNTQNSTFALSTYHGRLLNLINFRTTAHTHMPLFCWKSVPSSSEKMVRSGSAGDKARLQVFLDSLPVEIAFLVIVAVYALLIFVDLGTNELFFPGGCGMRIQCISPRRACAVWLSTFMIIDSIFLSIFMIEIIVRLYAFGWWYLNDCLTSFDAAIIVISLGFCILQAISGNCDSTEASTANEVSTLARLIRILRVFRLLTAMHKINRTRQTARMMRQKVRYLSSACKLGCRARPRNCGPAEADMLFSVARRSIVASALPWSACSRSSPQFAGR